MSVVIETTLGDITVDLFLQQRPVTCLNFLKLCKMKYYNYNLFHSIRSGFIAQTGDPTGEGINGESIFGVLEGREKRFFSGEKLPKIRHTNTGTLSMVCTDDMMVGSQFFFTLAPDLDSLDSMHCVIGEVTEGHDVLRKLNDVICDEKHRPYRDVRITHTVILEDPFNDPSGFHVPSRSPSPSTQRLKGGRIAPDEDIDEAQGKSAAEIQEMIEEKEAKARATILEIVGDLPDAEIAPPENVLFVCKLNPVTTDEDLEIIFSRFGTIVGCEVIRDKKTGDSLQYAFVEFSDKKSCEEAYFKMDNVLIDDRRIHVDFSQSVSKMRYLGKGRGVQYFNDDNDSSFQGNTNKDINRNNNGDYKNGKTDKTKENKDSDKHDDKDKYKRSRSRERDRKKSRRERSRSKRERSRTRRERSRSRRNRSRSRSKRTSKSSRHRKRSSSRSRNARSRDRRRDRKSRSDRKSSRDRRLRSPSPYSRRSRSRIERSRDSKRDRKDSGKLSKRDKSYERKRDKSTSRSRSNSKTRSRKLNDNKVKIETKSMPVKSQESSTDDITGSASDKNILILRRSRSKSQNKSDIDDQTDIINNYQAETIKIQEEKTPVVIDIVKKDRKSDLKANYNTYWRKSAQETQENYPQEQMNYAVLNTLTTSTTSLIDKSKEKTEKHKVSRWEQPQESNIQDDQTLNKMEIEEATTCERVEGSSSLLDQSKEKYETSSLSLKNYSQVEQTIDKKEKSETSKWRRIQDVTTLVHSHKVQSKSRSKSPIETVKERTEDIKVNNEESQLEIKLQEIDNNTARSRSKSPRPEHQPKSQREENTSESKVERIRKISSNSNHNNRDDIKTLSKPKSAKLDESSQNDRDLVRSRSKSYDNNVSLRREKSMEPTPEIESRKLSKTDDSNKKDEDKKSHKLKKLKHHKEVNQKSEKKHKKSKEAIYKKKHKTAKTKKNKKVSKKRKRKHSTSSSSDSSDSSSSIESSSSSEDERKKRSLKRRKKKPSTSSSSESSSSSSTNSSATTSSSSSDSEPSKKKRKKVISSKASKKSKKKQ